MNPNTELSIRILTLMRQLRKRRGWTMEHLAKEVRANGYEITGVNLNNYESRAGRRPGSLSVDLLVALARAFGMSAGELIDAASGDCGRCGGDPPAGFICANCGAGFEGS